jgi:hypothetical protein
MTEGDSLIDLSLFKMNRIIIYREIHLINKIVSNITKLRNEVGL